MSTQRALKRSRVARGGSPAPPAGLPSLQHGMQGLNHLAGNAGMAALIARRPAKQPPHVKDLLDEGPEGEEELAALRLTLDDFAKLMMHLDKARDAGRGAYPDLRAWILELIKRLHLALEGAHGYEGELGKRLEALERLPRDPGKHRLQVLSELARKLQAEAERIYGTLSKGLPPPGSQLRRPHSGEGAAKERVHELGREIAKAIKQADADVEPDGSDRKKKRKR